MQTSPAAALRAAQRGSAIVEKQSAGESRRVGGNFAAEKFPYETKMLRCVLMHPGVNACNFNALSVASIPVMRSGSRRIASSNHETQQ
jgi:hypothetical protein